MTLTQILMLAALTIYAVYRQSVRHQITGRARFKLAIIYGIVGIAVGGFDLPPDARSWLALVAGLVLSLVVGILRGRMTRLWRDSDAKVYSQGTWVTIGLFLLLVGSKWIYGAIQYFEPTVAGTHGGFGEIMVMIAVMIAVQAEIIHRRALALLEPGLAPRAAA